LPSPSRAGNRGLACSHCSEGKKSQPSSCGPFLFRMLPSFGQGFPGHRSRREGGPGWSGGGGETRGINSLRQRSYLSPAQILTFTALRGKSPTRSDGVSDICLRGVVSSGGMLPVPRRNRDPIGFPFNSNGLACVNDESGHAGPSEVGADFALLGLGVFRALALTAVAEQNSALCFGLRCDGPSANNLTGGNGVPNSGFRI